MMRQIIRVVVTVVAVMAVAFTAAAQSSDPLFGTWKQSLAKSALDPGPGPKSQTVKIEPWEGGMKLTTDTVNAQGQPAHMEVIFKLDGKDYPVKGTATAANTTRAYKKVGNHLEYVIKVDGKVTSTSTWMVSQDGKTFTSIARGTTPQGQPSTELRVYDRQ